MKTCEESDITKFFDDSRGMQGGFSQVLPLRELKIPSPQNRQPKTERTLCEWLAVMNENLQSWAP